MKPGTAVFLYLDNHSQITALEDYYQLLLSECVDRGGALHLTSSLNNSGHTVLIDEFTNPNFCQQIESEFQIDDERLTIVATEILRNGVFNSAQTQQKSNEELMSEGVRRVQEKDHYRRQRYWEARTQGFLKAVVHARWVVCAAIEIYDSLREVIPDQKLIFWPFRYSETYATRPITDNPRCLDNKTFDFCFSGVTTSHREETLATLGALGASIGRLGVQTPNFFRHNIFNQTLFLLAPKHFPYTDQLSSTRVHWALCNKYPMIVERCNNESHFDEYLVFFENGDHLVELWQDKENTIKEYFDKLDKFREDTPKSMKAMDQYFDSL